MPYDDLTFSRIILNPSEQQKQGFETATFAENEVYGIDVLVSSADDGKVIVPFMFSRSNVLTFPSHARRNRGQQSTHGYQMLPTS